MKRIKSGWKRIPNKPRQALVLTLGLLIIILSGIIGALPGPGGTIIFLLGIAVLATEFTWAQRFRDLILTWLQRIANYMRAHPGKSTLLILVCIGISLSCAYAFYSYIR